MFDFTDSPCFIVAELSANHGHQLETAKRTIRAAKEAGADAIKIQTYTPDTLTIACSNRHFQINTGTLWDGKTLHELYQTAFTPWEWTGELQAVAEEQGLVFFSTPFDRTAVDFLEQHNVPVYKIASFEVPDIPLIEYVASKGKPMLLSTGIATLEEIEDAVDACRRMGNDQITLLKCTSEYPARIEDANLNTMVDMATRFGVSVGLSDHTMGHTVAVAAAALGARVIEKHFILDRAVGGPDATFSMTPEEFATMVKAVRDTEKTLGRVDYEMTDSKLKSRIFARSLFVVEAVKKGETFTRDNLRSIRPGHGMAPKHYAEVLGRKAACEIERGTPLSWDLIEKQV